MSAEVFNQVTDILGIVNSSPNIIGGEPTLAPDFHTKIVNIADATTTGAIRIVTNGWFYTSPLVRRKFATMIEQLLGYNDLYVSVKISNDRFHREFWKYPDQPTKIKVWLEAAFERARLLHVDTYNDDQSRFPVQPFGRGKDYYTGSAQWYSMECVDGDRFDDETEEFDWRRAWERTLVYPNGDVSPCCCSGGIMIGNVLLHSFNEITYRLEHYLRYAQRKHSRYKGERAMMKCSKSCKRMNYKYDYRRV